MRYFRHSPESIELMLKTVNKTSLDALFDPIPADLRMKHELKLPKALDELMLKRRLAPMSAAPQYISFLGAGATKHFVPEWVSQQILRAEWYTSYTPYQPEISQGNLQAIFEFQSMIASLFGLDVANASMYDGATALAEALLMAVRVTGLRRVALSSAIHPEYRETVRTYLGFANVEVSELAFDSQGLTILHKAENLAAIAIQSPNFFGQIEDIRAYADAAHAHNALMIGCSTDLSATGVLMSFGYQGADIAVGEGLGLVPGLNMGGPGVGLLACKKALLRHIPGRLVGETSDRSHKKGYVLTLAAREQHIRREKAVSNICTNHNLMALSLSMTLAAYGKKGFHELGLRNAHMAAYFRELLKERGVLCPFSGPHYNESVVFVGDETKLERRLSIALAHNMLGGVPLRRFYPELAGHLLVATTEMHDEHELRLLANILGGAHD